jgi:hypothetical protein
MSGTTGSTQIHWAPANKQQQQHKHQSFSLDTGTAGSANVCDIVPLLLLPLLLTFGQSLMADDRRKMACRCTNGVSSKRPTWSCCNSRAMGYWCTAAVRKR